MTTTKQVEKALKGTQKPHRILQNSDFLSMGLTLGNLSSYGRVYGGFVTGCVYRIIGKSQSSKTFLCKTILAEAANNNAFNNYDLIYDDIERGGQLIDTRKFFGSLAAERIGPPAWSKDKKPLYSKDASEYYSRLRTRLDKGKPFVYITDSLDALNAESTKMTDGKAKINSNELRKLIDGIDATRSILFLVQHCKVEIGKISFGPPKDYTTGGVSPEYYSSLDIWLQKIRTLKTTVNDVDYPVGVEIKAHIKKNRVSGVDRSFLFPLYYDYGIDDIGSCINWLIKVGHWTEEKKVITAPEFKFTGKAAKLIQKIENEGQRQELRLLVGKVWKEIEAKLTSGRKPRYS